MNATKAFFYATLLAPLAPISSLAESPVEGELKAYESLSRSLEHRVAKIERNAKACYKNLPSGYQAIISARGVFGMFQSGRQALSDNRQAVQSTFQQLFKDTGGKVDVASADSCAGSAMLGSAALSQREASVANAKKKLAALETGLLKTQKSLANPKDRSNIEYLINCGDPTAVRNFHTALDEYDRLVVSHGNLSRYLKEQELALASGSSGLAQNALRCGELAKAR